MSGARARVAALGALLLVVVAVVLLLSGGGDARTVTARFEDGGLLVKGNQVRVGGAVVGTVSRLGIGDDGRAEVELRITDDSALPLREGTRAIVRNSSVSSVAGRYVALELGPLDAREIPDGGAIPTIDTRAAVDFDEFLNTLDAESRRALQDLFASGDSALSGAETGLSQTLLALNPALGRVRDLAGQLRAEDPALQRLLVGTAAVSGAFAERRDDLREGLVATATTAGTLARERASLSAAIRRAPALLGQARRTLRDADGLVRDARPVARAARPVAPRLATVLRSAQPTARALRPLLRDVRATLPVLDEALVRLPRLETQAVPALEQTTDAVRALRPAVRGLRPFTPDLLHGILTSFGGRAGSNYDAIGHVGRISPIVNGASFPAVLRPIVGALDPLLEAIGFNGLGGYDARNVLRCPGGATGPAADGSRPWRDGVEGTCDVIDDGSGR